MQPINDPSSELWIRYGRRYGTAVLSTLVALWARSVLDPWLQEDCPFSLFYLSVLLTAWIAGTGPAVLAIVLGTFSAAHFFIAPANSIYIDNLPEMIQLGIYVIVNCVATLLFNRLERQRQLAEKRSAENEHLSHSLREADERKDEFLALLAHELRNPLAPIRSSLALLDRKGDRSDVILKTKEVIRRQTNHLVRITDDLLDVSRFCRGKVELQVEQLDLREPIDDAIEMTEGLMNAKSHRFQLLFPERPVWIRGDRVRLAQLIANLLSNAAKYTPSGGRITLQIEAIGPEVTISVTDNGIGFAPSEAERILQPFMQIDTSRTREYGGLGVGLTIVDRLVALHAGRLTAHSRGPGLGSCFTVTLPRAVASEVETADTLDAGEVGQTFGCESNPPGALDAATGDRRILIVEDNVDASALLGELLESEGCSVRLARDGVEALQETSRSAFDLIILDIGLPGMDGYEIARRIRRLELNPQPRLIALTGWGGSVNRELAAQAGFDVHLVKPIVFQELLEQVDRTFEERASRPKQHPAVAV